MVTLMLSLYIVIAIELASVSALMSMTGGKLNQAKGLRVLRMGPNYKDQMSKARQQKMDQESKSLNERVKKMDPPVQSSGSVSHFSDEMYDNLNDMIKMLSNRMKSDRALSTDALAKLERTMQAIIMDARSEGAVSSVPSAPVSSGQESPRQLRADNPYLNEFRGKSTWDVPGMETMSTEEYYKAVNARIRRVKNVRVGKAEPLGPQSVDDYFATLNGGRL